MTTDEPIVSEGVASIALLAVQVTLECQLCRSDRAYALIKRLKQTSSPTLAPTSQTSSVSMATVPRGRLPLRLSELENAGAAGGAIVGMVICAVISLVLLTAAVFFAWRASRYKREAAVSRYVEDASGNSSQHQDQGTMSLVYENQNSRFHSPICCLQHPASFHQPLYHHDEGVHIIWQNVERFKNRIGWDVEARKRRRDLRHYRPGNAGVRFPRKSGAGVKVYAR